MNRSLLLIICFYGCILLAGIGSWGVIETSEARYAEISREMVQSGDWMHPKLLGIYHYHKPPLTYWLTAVGYSIFGVNEIGVRFFLVVALLFQIVLVYRIALVLLKDEDQALHAAVIYAALPMVLVSVRGLTTDAYLNTFVLASILCWMLRRTELKVIWSYLCAIFLGLCFLTKGPVGLLVPVLVMGGMRGVLSRNKITFSYHRLLAVVIFIVLAFGWFAYLAFDDRRFVDYFLLRHTVERFAHADVFTRTQPWWYYLCFGPLLALPWLFVIPFTPTAAWKTFPPGVRRVATFWILIPLLFFSLSSSKLVLYILPLFGGVSIAGAACLNGLGTRFSKFENTFFYFVLVLFIGMATGLHFVEAISPSWLVWLSLSAISALALIKLNMSMKRMSKVIAYSLCWSGFLILFSTFLLSTNELKVNSTLPLSDWIVRNHMNNRQVMVYNKLLPSLSFDLNREIISLDDGDRYLEREVQFEKDTCWKRNLYDLQDPHDVIRLKRVLVNPTVMISKKDIGKNAVWMKSEFKKIQRLGDWIIFYN